MVKVTYTFDDDTVQRIRRVAARLGKPQSFVVREAVKDYESRADRLSDDERARMLAALDDLLPRIPKRTQTDVNTELAEIRRARRRPRRRSGT